jgi:hypothetical protein
MQTIPPMPGNHRPYAGFEAGLNYVKEFKELLILSIQREANPCTGINHLPVADAFPR